MVPIPASSTTTRHPSLVSVIETAFRVIRGLNRCGSTNGLVSRNFLTGTVDGFPCLGDQPKVVVRLGCAQEEIDRVIGHSRLQSQTGAISQPPISIWLLPAVRINLQEPGSVPILANGLVKT